MHHCLKLKVTILLLGLIAIMIAQVMISTLVLKPSKEKVGNIGDTRPKGFCATSICAAWVTAHILVWEDHHGSKICGRTLVPIFFSGVSSIQHVEVGLCHNTVDIWVGTV
jgi:hypothetical protein